ncbi:MAG TPA: aminotransferase class V-fold PLP-dependent enzyme [Bacteroidales bacterium]|nr:aminotransferase class V-fold PLP-dependent enzyme [Bacteroidales bacterium]HQN16490.1 aminotransferase class V-fold PLP-dependent enzyme [Bacteroidales bacterium]HQP15242.1 aminotransferase class V-fold PLP-dependent enzyme [Bacteroidales bacterium]
MTPLEQHFSKFKKNIVGNDLMIDTPYGKVKMIYADWIASGRFYKPIEKIISEQIGPYIGNTHTETSETGTLMTLSYHLAHKKIKEHVHASDTDVIITAGFGMTSVVNKLQRILGLRTCGMINKSNCLQKCEKPVVFISHMEHHSNHTSWYETNAEVVLIKPGKDLLFDLNNLEKELKRYKDRKFKIGSFTACSNVTGISTPYHQIAKLMHRYGGICFVDFAASAPYCDINMHPEDPMEKLDAIFFSPHKFLGGPGSSGVLVFDSSLYPFHAPDQPGGGTVDWTNPWGEYKYIDNIEAREDGGTPGFLQAIRSALCIELKNKMGTANIQQREQELLKIAFKKMPAIPGLHILAENIRHRLGVISFYIDGLHYNLAVRLLNDRFGIQVRGGCACAGTYGHYLLNVSYQKSRHITSQITRGNLSEKPGWVRLSLHPTMTDEELNYIIKAIALVAKNFGKWVDDYNYNPRTNEYKPKKNMADELTRVSRWFKL